MWNEERKSLHATNMSIERKATLSNEYRPFSHDADVECGDPCKLPHVVRQ